MAKQVTMKKGEDVIKCSEDYVEHFEKAGYTLEVKKKVVQKTEKVIKQEEKKK